MKSIPVAITWEILRKGNWNFLLGFLGGNLIPILIYGIFRRQGVDFHDPSLVMIYSTFFLVNWILFFGVALAASGPPSRLYHLPISTSSLVACHLFPTMILVALEMFLSLVLQNALFDLQLPLWSPLLFSSTAIALFLATLWFTEKSAWMLFAESFVVVVLAVWFHCRFSRPEYPLNQFWIASIPGELLILFVALLVSYFVSLNGMARNRCGEQLKPWGIFDWICRLLDGTSQEPPRFRSAAEAQAWYEWQLKGWMFPITVIFALVIGFAIWVSLIRDPQHLIGGLLGIGMMMPMISIVWAIIIGNVGPMDSNLEMRSFLASRPMTSKDMARTILTMTAKSIMLSWSLWVGSLLIVIAILMVTGTAPQPLFPPGYNWSIFPLTLLGSWTVVSVLSSFGLTGRTTLLAKLFCGLFATQIAVVCFSELVLPKDSRPWLWGGNTLLWSSAYIAGTVWCFATAHRRNLIESPLLVGACGVWFLLSSIAITTWVRYPTTPAVNCALFVGLAGLVVAPLAAAPLALAWNRTR